VSLLEREGETFGKVFSFPLPPLLFKAFCLEKRKGKGSAEEVLLAEAVPQGAAFFVEKGEGGGWAF